MNEVDRAVELFKAGCACSQAVLASFGPKYGLDEALSLRLAAGFAGGMRRAETCGAVTGALMTLGLAHCYSSCANLDGRKAAYQAVTAFQEAFIRKNGSLLCRDLLGCDISTPEGAKIAQEKGLFNTKCVELVREAALLLKTMAPEASARK